MSTSLLRSRPLPVAEIDRLRRGIEDFLATSRLEESNLILDGPGLGLSTVLIALALLGPDRLRRFQAIHSFSASGYSVFFSLARATGDFTWPLHRISEWNRENQKRHAIRPAATLLQVLGRKITGRRYLFPGARVEEALTHSVSEKFARTPLAELPANLRFWCYGHGERDFVSLDAAGAFSSLLPGQVMRAMAAVPEIYEPLRLGDAVYSDALLARGIRDHYRKLRGQAASNLFFHMHTDGKKDGTHFIKLHRSASGYSRVVTDFLYFVSGAENHEFTDGFRKAMFEIRPI